jgi:hypothetical protein
VERILKILEILEKQLLKKKAGKIRKTPKTDSHGGC